MKKKGIEKKQNVNKAAKSKSLPVSNLHPDFSKILLLIGIVILTILCYSGILSSQFVNIDDSPKILENQLIQDFSFSGIKNMFTSYVFHSYLPLTLFFQSFIYNIWNYNPSAFHFFNLFFHVLCTIAVYFFILKLTKKNQLIALITTALFALHPMNVETVAWTSEFSNVLFGFFFVFSLYFYVTYVDEQKPSFYLLSFILFILSLLSKSSAVPLSVTLFLIDYYRNRKFTAKLVTEKIPFLAASLIFGAVAIHAMYATENIREIGSVYSFIDRFFLISYPLAFYLVKFLAPFNLSIFNSFPQKSDGFLPIEFYLSILVIALFIFFIFKAKKIKKELIFGSVFFLFNIGLLIHIIPFGGDFITAEHFVYIPYIGFAFIIASLLAIFREHSKSVNNRKIAYYFLTAYILFFSLSTWSRSQTWKDSISLFKNEVEKNPDNATALYGLGSAYQSEGRFTEALQNYNKALEVKPGYTEAYYNRGLVNLQLKNKEAALSDFTASLKADSSYYLSYNNRGNVRKETGDTIGALADFSYALKIKPDYAIAYYNRGSLYSNFKQYDKANADLTKAISLKPDYADAYNNRGIVYFYQKEFQNSINDYSKAISLQSKNGNLYKNRGLSQLAIGDTLSACKDWYFAVDLGFKPAAGLIKKHCKN